MALDPGLNRPVRKLSRATQRSPSGSAEDVVCRHSAGETAGVYARLATRPGGFTVEEAAKRLAEHGPNVLAKDQRAGIGRLLRNAVVNPLVILLLVLMTISFATGDNELVARKVCTEVGLATEFVLLGSEVEKLTDDHLADAAERTTLFARVSPAHKQRIIAALQSRKHTVGFMGDGINDAPALRTADVGISVDTAAARSASLFQTGWFVESLLTQTLIIHVIRTNRIPFLQSMPA